MEHLSNVNKTEAKADTASAPGQAALMHGEISALRNDMKAAIADFKNSIIRWSIGAVLLSQLLAYALLKAFGL